VERKKRLKGREKKLNVRLIYTSITEPGSVTGAFLNLQPFGEGR